MAERAGELFLAYFEQVRELHARTHGDALQAYKDTDSECLVSVFDRLLQTDVRGAAFVAEFLHRLSWAQCLENGNHRTTFLFLAALLKEVGVDWPPEALHHDSAAVVERIDAWLIRSKTLISKRGKPGSSQARLEPEHLAAARQWVEREIPDQSEALAMVGPQRLMSFLSRSDS